MKHNLPSISSRPGRADSPQMMMDTSISKESDAIRTFESSGFVDCGLGCAGTASTSPPGTVLTQEGTFQDDDTTGNYGEVAYGVDSMTLVSTFSNCSSSVALTQSDSIQSKSSRSSRRSSSKSKSVGSGYHASRASSRTSEAEGSGIQSSWTSSKKPPRSVGTGNRLRGASSRTSHSARSGNLSIRTSHSTNSANSQSGMAKGPFLGKLHATLNGATDGKQGNHSTAVFAMIEERDALCDETDACDQVVREEPSAGDCNIDDLIHDGSSVLTCNDSAVSEEGVSVVTEFVFGERLNAGYRYHHITGFDTTSDGGNAVKSASNLRTNKAKQQKPELPATKLPLMVRSMKRLHMGMASKRFTKSTTKYKDSVNEATTTTDQYKPQEKPNAKNDYNGKSSAAFWRLGPGISNHAMTLKKVSWMIPKNDEEVAGGKEKVCADQQVAKLNKPGHAASEFEDEAETTLTPTATEVEVLKRGKTEVSQKKKITGTVNLMKSSKKEHPVAIAANGKSATDKPEIINTHNSDASAEIKSSPFIKEDSKEKSVAKPPEDMSPILDDNFDQALMTTNAVAFDEPCTEYQEPSKLQLKKEHEAETHQQPKQDGFLQCQSLNFHETTSSQVNNIRSSLVDDTTHALMSPRAMSDAISLASTRLTGYFRCKSTTSAASTIDAVSPEYKPDSQLAEPSNTTDNSFTTERKPPEQPPMEDIEPKTHKQPNQEKYPHYPPPHHQMGEPADDIEVLAYFREHKGGSVISCIRSTTLHSAGIKLHDKDDFTASELVETEDMRSRTKINDIARKELKIDCSLHSHSSLPAKSIRMNFSPFSKDSSKYNINNDINTGNDKKHKEQKCDAPSLTPSPVISDKSGQLESTLKFKRDEKKCNEASRKHHQSSSTPPPISFDKPGHLKSSAPHGKTYVSPTQKKLFFAVETLKTKEAVASAKRCELQKKLKHLTNLRRGGNAVDEEERFNLIRKNKEEVASAAAEHAKAALELVLTTAEVAKARDDVRRVFGELRKEILVKPSADTQTMQCTTADTNSVAFSSVEDDSTKYSQEPAENFCSVNQIWQETSETIDDLHFCGTFLGCLVIEDGDNSLRTFETTTSATIELGE